MSGLGPPDRALSWNPHPPEGGSHDQWLQWANEMPICRALGLVCSQLADGQLTARVETPPLVPNPNGSVHGGMQLAIADHCMGLVALTVMPSGTLPVSASVHASFHRPALPPLTFRGQVLSAGRTLVHTEIELYDESGRLCTSAYGAMATLPGEAVTSDAST